ncbi:MAG: MFS transporter, partial [Chloroflexota bacterium]|nr:MFS transporter [Chloroflexota bacterium]
GALISTGITMIGDLFDVRQRGRVQGFTASMWATSAIIGPTIGGIITQTLSWRWTFYVNLPIGLLAIILLLNLHDREEHHGGSIDWLGAIVFASAATSLLLGLNGTYPFITIPLAVVLTLAFLAIERRSAQPLVDLSLFGMPLISVGLALTLVMGIAQFGATTFVPPFAQGVLGRSPIEAGLALGAMTISWPIGSVTTGWFLLRIGLRRVVVTGSLFALAGALVLMAMTADSPFALLVIGPALMGLGQGVMSTPLLVGAQTAVGYRKRGVVTSLLNFTRTLGGAVGVASLGAVLNAAIGPRADELQPLLDPRGHGTLSAAGEDARLAFAGGLHTVYLALLVLAVIGVVLALRLPAHDFEARADEATESDRIEAAGQ